jgi:hypothetical protein
MFVCSYFNDVRCASDRGLHVAFSGSTCIYFRMGCKEYRSLHRGLHACKHWTYLTVSTMISSDLTEIRNISFLKQIGDNLRCILLCTGINPLTPELNPSAQRCLTRFFARHFASWTVHFVIICVKTNKCHNYSFSLLIMDGGSYMCQHYVAIFRERS